MPATTHKNDDEPIIVGQLGAAHGVKGWIKLHSFTEPKHHLFRYQPWLVQQADGWQSLSPEASEQHSQSFVVKFPDCTNREQAESYRHCHIAILPHQLPELPAGEYYWHDLTGLKVINHQGKVFGTVSHLIATGSNDVLVVNGDRQRMIPYIKDDYITAIDLQAGEIHVQWDADF